jgi:dipeptidase D
MSVAPASPFADLPPSAVWRHFQTLCEIPRVSKHEAGLRDHLQRWADARGLDTQVDAAGNLIIRKTATAGNARRPGVVLQGHLDMVCQKNDGVDHDFYRDPIRPVLRDGWLIAQNTTLGADNGIGVALTLAVLEADEVPHGPLEVLLTVDEEAGMGGAQGLDGATLSGELLINIDTEEWGQFYLGCAGGLDVLVEHRCAVEPPAADHLLHTISIKGLTGGHSGIDIHLGRGHAIKLLLRLLRQLERDYAIRIAALSGGTARNALPREASATISFAAVNEAAIIAALADYQTLLRDELSGVGEQVCVLVANAPAASTVLVAPDQSRLLAALNAAPQGVRRMSTRVDGVVETSDNLGVIRLADGRCEAVFMVRSLIDSAAQSLADDIGGLFTLIGARAEKTGAYPGWKPNPDSALLRLCQGVYTAEFGSSADIKVIHAGLECGIIGAKYPQMDMISFGPDIRGAHAPGERVNVASVEHCWRLLTAILAALAAPAA